VQDYQTETYVGLAIKESGLPRSSLYITTKYSSGKSPRQSIQQSLNKVRPHIWLTSCSMDLIVYSLRSAFPMLICIWCTFRHSFLTLNLGGKNLRRWRKMDWQGVPFATRTGFIGLHSYQEHWRQQLYSRGPSESAEDCGYETRCQPGNFLQLNQIQPMDFAVQIPFHPYNYTSHKALLEYCAKHNITVEAYGSLKWVLRPPLNNLSLQTILITAWPALLRRILEDRSMR